jgi:hypothetical protein
MSTKLNPPATVTRTVAHRLILELSGEGVLQVWDHEKRQTLSSPITLTAQNPHAATLRLSSAFDAGSLVVQQSIWQEACAAEVTMHLGSVDFQYLTGATYVLYPQDQRVNEVKVTFLKTETGAAIVGEVTTKDGVLQTQRVDFKPKTSFSALITGLTERYVVEEDGRIVNGTILRQQRVAPLGTHAEVVFVPPITGLGASLRFA